MAMADELRLERYGKLRMACDELAIRIVADELTEEQYIAAEVELWQPQCLAPGSITSEENDLLMEYILFEQIVEGMNRVQRFASAKDPGSRIQREVLKAMCAARSGFHRILSCDKIRGLVELEDLRSGERLQLTDLGLSEVSADGWLMFMRPIVLPELVMSTGIGFPFPGRMVEELLRAQESWQVGDALRQCFALHSAMMAEEEPDAADHEPARDPGPAVPGHS